MTYHHVEHRTELWSAVEFCHMILRRFVPAHAAARVLDATAGNGYDTCFILDILDDKGEVLAIDIQQQAIDVTAMRIAQHPRAAQARVELCAHRDVASLLERYGWSSLHAVVLNCGYLPGTDKSIRTTAHGTRDLLHMLIPLLEPGGVICAVCYTGHDGGIEERDAVLELCRSVAKNRFRTAVYTNPGRLHAPECYCIERVA